jgi:hypothetical protein
MLLSEPHARAAAIFGDELDAGRFKCPGQPRNCMAVGRPVDFGASDRVAVNAGLYRQLPNSPIQEPPGGPQLRARHIGALFFALCM